MSNQTTTRPSGTRDPRHATRRRARMLLLSAGCVGMLWLGGCGRDADEKTVTEASIKLAAMDDGWTTPEASAKATYDEVINSLQSIASGDNKLAADAAILVAEAHQGLAVQAAERATDLLREAQLKQPGIRAQLRAWQMHNAAANAAASYDPTEELANLDSSTRDRQDKVEAERTRKSEIESNIASLLGQVTDLLSQASELRSKAGTLRLEIARVSETEGLSLTEQIRELSRQADKLEFKAREIKVQADRRNLDLHASEVEIDKLTNQIELLGQSRSAVQTRAAAAKEQAARARADAQKAAVAIAAAIDTGDGALTPFLDSQVRSTVEEAVKGFQNAASAANSAKSARKSSAQLAIGKAQQNIGDTQWSYALGLDAYAQLMEELASAQPALPAAAEYASRAKDARQQAADAKQAAYDAYQSAKSAYEATGASGDARDHLTEVGKQLNEASRIVGDGVVDADALESLSTPETDESDSGDETGNGAAADTTNAEADIRNAITNALEDLREGRYAEAQAFLVPAGQAEEELLSTVISPLISGLTRLDAVTEEAFDTRFAEWMMTNQEIQQQMMGGFAAGGGFDPGTISNFNAEDLDIRVKGDEAVVLSDSPDAEPMPLRRVNGEWKLSLELPADADMDQQMAMMQPIIQTVQNMLGQAADKVESGELQSNQAVAAWMNQQMMQVFMQLMQEQGDN